MDLIQDNDLWGNMDKFIESVDKNSFSGKSPRKNGLFDKIMDGACIREQENGTFLYLCHRIPEILLEESTFKSSFLIFLWLH